MANNQFINLEELSKTTQALLSKINEQSNLKVNKTNVSAEYSEGTKIGSIEGTDFYTPEVDTSNFVTYDDLNLAQVAYSGNYNDLTNAPTLAAVATSGDYNSLTSKPILPTIIITPSSSGSSPCSATIMGVSSLIEVYPDIGGGSGGEVYFYLNRFAKATSGNFSIKLDGYTYDISILNQDGTQDSSNDSIGPGLFYGRFYYERTYSFTIYRNTQANNALKVRGHTVSSDVPADAVFTDTVYDDTAISSRITTLENAGYQNSTQVNSAIATAIGNINQFEVAIVTDLPTTNIDTHTIYFKSNSSSGNNIYDEYMYINSNWELIGSTQIDLTPYARSADLATVATSGDYDDLTDAPIAEIDANVETMLNSFNLDYTSNTSSPNIWQGGSY